MVVVKNYSPEDLALLGEAKPCPFCGSRPELYRDLSNGEPDEVFLQCTNIGCPSRSETVKMEEIETTIKRWNRRTKED